jgi:ATP-dependent Clp protease ATP-binding subunit ClpB
MLWPFFLNPLEIALGLVILTALLGNKSSQDVLLVAGGLWLLYRLRRPLWGALRKGFGSLTPLSLPAQIKKVFGGFLFVVGWIASGSLAFLLLSHLLTRTPNPDLMAHLILLGVSVNMVLWGRLLWQQKSPPPAPVKVRRTLPREEADFSNLEHALKGRVIGQDHAVEAVVRGLKRKAAGLTRKEKPFSAMLAGPTGTGKTELAKALAETLGRPLVRYDMNQYGQDHTVAALVGSPPGYVGSDRPGRLYEDLARYPNAVVLFDEMEKAHPRVLDPLLQLLDEGRFQELSQGLVVSAPNAILLFTTNLLSREAFEGRGEIPEHLLRAELVRLGLRPEFVNRLDAVVAFRPFTEEALKRVAERHLRDYLNAWKRQTGNADLRVQVDPAVYDLLLSQVDIRFGARDLQRAIETLLGDPLAEAYLRAKGKGLRELRVHPENGELVVELT